ncbi:PREDICTED: putative nuclease HARBI1 [Rhagoletis zephyria]|uniref:putative nuclease HARBI1 n=1 Tax=Rhagoletis zephyria TaxID=28612 RepID=UPI0008115582|nr:PREDICTED: putative nuclease HARBI1 [Rhagoletis zephyria]
MTENEKRDAKRHFFRTCGIPGVVGAVDGTHIQMIRPVENEHLYFNRKLKHSLNAMVICDHNMKIRAVDGRYGGACHDSHIWNISGERRYLKGNYENGESGTWILGDSGYPLEPWILTPYRNVAENSHEAKFNENFAKGRCIIERCFGVLKARFRCLLASRELHYAPQKCVQILNACCALHNICILYKIAAPSDIPVEEDFSTTYMYSSVDIDLRSAAVNIRDDIRNNMFTRVTFIQ